MPKEPSRAGRRARRGEQQTQPPEGGQIWNRKWDAQFEKLKQFKLRRGHCDVPRRHGDGALASWVFWQRERHRSGELRGVRRERLEGIGFNFGFKKSDRWEERLAELAAFRARHGHCNVRLRHPGGLGTWVREQRRDHRLRNRHHTRERVEKLEALGFCWKVPVGLDALESRRKPRACRSPEADAFEFEEEGGYTSEGYGGWESESPVRDGAATPVRVRRSPHRPASEGGAPRGMIKLEGPAADLRRSRRANKGESNARAPSPPPKRAASPRRSRRVTDGKGDEDERTPSRRPGRPRAARKDEDGEWTPDGDDPEGEAGARPPSKRDRRDRAARAAPPGDIDGEGARGGTAGPRASPRGGRRIVFSEAAGREVKEGMVVEGVTGGVMVKIEKGVEDKQRTEMGNAEESQGDIRSSEGVKIKIEDVEKVRTKEDRPMLVEELLPTNSHAVASNAPLPNSCGLISDSTADGESTEAEAVAEMRLHSPETGPGPCVPETRVAGPGPTALAREMEADASGQLPDLDDALDFYVDLCDRLTEKVEAQDAEIESLRRQLGEKP